MVLLMVEVPDTNGISVVSSSLVTSAVDPFELVVTLIEAMALACRERNCRLVVMKFGTFADPEHKGLLEVDARFEKAFARVKGVPYLDLDDEFQRRRLKTRDLVAGNQDNGFQCLRSLTLWIAESDPQPG